MRRILSASLVLLAFGAAEARAADIADINKRGSIRVLAVLDAKRPEFFSTRQGSLPGFDHEMLQGFANLHKLKLEVVPIAGWDGLIPALQEGKGDVIAGRFTATDTRRRVIDFTVEVFPYRLVVMTRKPNKPIGTVEELRAAKVGTIKGTQMAEAVAGAGVPSENVDDGVAVGAFDEALKSGRITAAVWGVESAIATQREDPDIQLGMFLGTPLSLAYGVRKDAPGLRKALDDYIENMRRTPTWSRLVVKYFGQAAPEILRKARTAGQ